MPRGKPVSSHTTLGPGGRAYWDSITSEYQLDDTQILLLLEACRCKDRLDKLDALLRGDIATWVEIRGEEGDDMVLFIDKAASSATAIQNMMKQLVATLRLTETKTGFRPSRGGNTGAARGTHNKGTTGKPQAVSALDRARERAKSA